jgi:hypothetical protein
MLWTRQAALGKGMVRFESGGDQKLCGIWRQFQRPVFDGSHRLARCGEASPKFKTIRRETWMDDCGLKEERGAIAKSG